MWARYRRERVALPLIALAALAIVNVPNTTDASRLALTEAVVDQGTLRIDCCAPRTTDRALYDGHVYSDKAPGVSFLAIPALLGLRGLDAARDAHVGVKPWYRRGHLWVLRVFTGGLGFLLAVFLVGRAAEGLAQGTGAAAAVTYGLGTVAGPLAATTFGSSMAGALALGAFLLVRQRRSLVLAALAAGTAVLFEYQAVILGALVLAYAAVSCGRRASRVVLGALPPAIALGAYDWAAFGSPFHLSYRYVAPPFAAHQKRGFFGIGLPSIDGLGTLLGGERGLLVVSPVLALAAAGLVLLWRRGLRAEAGVAALAALGFLLLNAGYFDVYGGTSPGARLMAPALPFLCLGLADAFRRAPHATAVLATVSIALCTLDALAWAISNSLSIAVLPETIWSLAAAPRSVGVGLVCLATAGAAAVGWFSLARSRPA